MTVNYVGRSKDYYYRIAEINYDDDTEQKLMDKVQEKLCSKGYNVVNAVAGWASCEVEDMEEYKGFVRDYKEAKKEAGKELKENGLL